MLEFFIIIFLVVILILVISIKNSLDSQIKVLYKKIDSLKEELKHVAKREAPPAKQEQTFASPSQTVHPPAPVQQLAEERPVSVQSPTYQQPVKKEQSIAMPRTPVAKPVSAPKPKQPGFFERNPDLEKFIGENLMNKIGIAILVLGIGFFVKFAIDKNWINEIGRAFIGLLAGGILIGIAHKLRKNFKAFSSVLVGGGLAVFYFTVAITFHEYHLISQTAAFLVMVAITGFAVALSLAYDKVELAVLAIIGGFVSPLLLSTGEGNYIVLFSYVLILNVGMLILAYFKKWRIVNIVSYVFTILLFGTWLTMKFSNQYAGALIFSTIFYLVFFAMNIINNIKENQKFNAADISILLSNTFLYYTAGMFILKDVQQGDFQGLFTAAIAVFNFVFAYTLFRSNKADKTLVYLLIGLVLTFLSLAAPIQLEGNYITLFWSAEAVLLLWLSQKSGITLMKIASIIVLLLMLGSLIMDWEKVYQTNQELAIVFNKIFLTGLGSLVSLFLYRWLLGKEEGSILQDFSAQYVRTIVGFLILVFMYLTFLLELNYQVNLYYINRDIPAMVLGSYNFFYVFGLLIFAYRAKQKEFKVASVVLSCISLVSYLFYYHNKLVDVRNGFLYNEYTTGIYIYHYTVSGLILAVTSLALAILINMYEKKSAPVRTAYWISSFAVLFVLSAELDHAVAVFAFQPDSNIYTLTGQNHKIGFPVLWGVCSFIIMFLGMRNKIKDLRIISLSLFFFTLVKLFVFDLRNISEGGKIFSFICLGIILLIVSFMYQKLKKLIIEDDVKV